MLSFTINTVVRSILIALLPTCGFVPDQFIPYHFVPNHFVLDHFVPDQFIPDHFVPDQFIADHFVPDEFGRLVVEKWFLN